MKKLYTLIATVSLSISGTFGQMNIQDYNGGSPTGPNLNGTTIVKTAGNNDLVVVDLGVTNISGADKFWQVRRVRITEVPAWTPTEQTCWGFTAGSGMNIIIEGNCYQTNAAQSTWTSPAWNNPMPADTTSNLKFDIHTNSIDFLHYRFYILENGTKLDSVDVKINPTLGINNAKKENVQINLYPNPTSNFLHIASNEEGVNYDIKITDVLGKVVFDESQASISKIDVSNFKNGVYLVAIFDKGQLIQTRRIVVKH